MLWAEIAMDVVADIPPNELCELIPGAAGLGVLLLGSSDSSKFAQFCDLREESALATGALESDGKSRTLNVCKVRRIDFQSRWRHRFAHRFRQNSQLLN
jgi:hypothetical protein